MKKIAAMTLLNSYQKGFRNGSLFWKIGFVFLLIIKIFSLLFSKAKPQTFAQYDLEPGEYKVIVSEKKK